MQTFNPNAREAEAGAFEASLASTHCAPGQQDYTETFCNENQKTKKTSLCLGMWVPLRFSDLLLASNLPACQRDRIAPAMLRQASYGTIKIGTYQSLKRLAVERPEGEWQPCLPGVGQWVVSCCIPDILGWVFIYLVNFLPLRVQRINELCSY